ncbi:sulfotransferase family 2 domain-containing protein [Okeanomitos corallinicola TIOX110]|uniref:Sulfotransferase family 2 domain-containing protein n=1 Tax=Okeanomitos corallinicola TIOX110 TaxID=3133117 RepID=A0ABZ2UP71_9CYAN
MLNELNDKLQEKLVFFIHLPKTGGTTMHSIIGKQYNSVEIFKTDQQYNSDFFVPDFDDHKKQQLKIVSGHYCFGYHKYFDRPFTYLTILRHPVERVISDYFHIINVPHHWLHKEVGLNNMTLEDFVTSGISKLTENAQVRFLSGKNFETDFGKCSEKMLEIAKNNLQSYFSVVGITEEFDPTLLLLKKNLGWKMTSCLYTKQRVGHQSRKSYRPSEDTYKLIESHNSLDMNLYDEVKSNFTQTIASQDNNFGVELQVFRTLKQWSQSYSSLHKKAKTAYRNLSKVNEIV